MTGYTEKTYGADHFFLEGWFSIEEIEKLLVKMKGRVITPPLPVQEPVAWMSSDRAWMWSDYSKAIAAVALIPTLTLIPLYAAPPQRPWQGLTDDDKQTAVWTDGTFGGGALWAQQLLKERNNG